MKQPMLNVLLSVLFVLGLAACEQEQGPAENAGENIDETVNDLRDEVDDAGDAVGEAAEEFGSEMEEAGEAAGDAAEDMGNQMEDACEDVMEGVNAENPDC